MKINGKEAGRIRIAGIAPEEIHGVMIPEEFKPESRITVKVKSADGKRTPMFYEVRLIK